MVEHPLANCCFMFSPFLYFVSHFCVREIEVQFSRKSEELDIIFMAFIQENFTFFQDCNHSSTLLSRQEKFTETRFNKNFVFCRVSNQYVYKILIAPLIKQTIEHQSNMADRANVHCLKLFSQ